MRGAAVRAALLACLLVVSAAGCASAALAPPPAELEPARWRDDALAVGWVGHASVLVGLSGSFVLTDPTFFDRVGPRVAGVTIGPRRLVRPAIALERLPPLAAVVVTHAHFDSLDLPSLEALPKDATLVGPPGCGEFLAGLGFRRYVELGWGERVTADGVEIEAVPVVHWGKRWPWERAARGYNGYLFSKGDARVLFASDTAFTRDFRRYRDGGPPLDVAILGNGAYDPWIRNHANPEQVWQMFLDSGARVLVPVHWDTFRLGREPLGDAIARLRAAAGDQTARIVVDRIGGEWRKPR
jgi:L-ascorbate metabolism protein UlaG (beta-lactamase superfamily)